MKPREKDCEVAARRAGWTFDEPANEYRLNDTGNGCDAIDANKTWRELCAFHGITVLGAHAMNVYTFRNEQSGETVRGEGQSLNIAARALGIEVPYRGKLPAPWVAIACHSRDGVQIWRDE